MAPTIKLLDENTKNLIAAGEVIERPASVVKELVENALDAGAGRITVECEGAGSGMIRVIDDGLGMSDEDAELAFRRHATSKITSAADLENISTMGFRGEALPSIASVSRFELETRRSEDDAATLIVVEGGRTVEKSATSRAPGTTVTVRNLFFNVPARRKFLKTDQTELRHITRTLTALAVAQIGVGIKLFHEGREIISANPADSVAERVDELFGPRAKGGYLPVMFERGGAVVGGLIAPPDSVGSRAEQYMFINRRPFSDRKLIHAVKQGYASTIADNGRPSFFLFLTLDPSEIDINVHPQKLEVRFRDGGLVFSMVYRAVQQGLRQDGATPSFSSPQAGKLISSGFGRPRDLQRRVAAFQRSETQTSFLMPLARPGQPAEKPENQPAFPAAGSGSGEQQTAPALDGQGQETVPALPSVWQLHNSYILVQTRGGCLIIDQHAAHERIIYEQLISQLAERKVSSQRLLFPVTFQLAPEERVAAEQFAPLLEQAGFDLEQFSGNTVAVRSVPSIRNLGRVEDYFRDLLRDLSEEGSGSTGTRHQALARSLACRAAIKAGTELSPAEMSDLIDRLFATDLPYADVHGRNTIVELELDEINRRFGRS
ncbi:MAG: DNA mismatch repair endonuclease MutL [Candidatus Glassbacteria bacterium]|nr:DNA mismatch repair endonuclease MutL [Candidatus Glassbacteria bacterium]